ncbi:MAG TPA: hypothetical protein VGY54_02750 [Polyangiaceae bacterium]|nr:hypothetical protein [Polyangiaceae bacterium]
MTIREPIADMLGSGMPTCGYWMTAWSEVIALCRDLMVTRGSRVPIRKRFVAIADSGGFASGLVMTVSYEVIVTRSQRMVITFERMVLR